jgi:hypothetical protein
VNRFYIGSARNFASENHAPKWAGEHMRKFYDVESDWDTFSATASNNRETARADEKNSSRAVLWEIGVVLMVALGSAAVLDTLLMYLHIRPFV